MGLFDGIRGQFIDIVEWLDDSRDTIVWRYPRGDNEIKDYIAEMYGHHQTGQRLSSVFSLLKAACISTEELNKRPIFNFRNGTLELETVDGLFGGINDYKSVAHTVLPVWTCM